ncbi:MAG: hypothetical protein IJ461_09095 [Clostridia bacterium]|nr:hypothetical protein [Clostridia bacterium]
MQLIAASPLFYFSPWPPGFPYGSRARGVGFFVQIHGYFSLFIIWLKVLAICKKQSKASWPRTALISAIPQGPPLEVRLD